MSCGLARLPDGQMACELTVRLTVEPSYFGMEGYEPFAWVVSNDGVEYGPSIIPCKGRCDMKLEESQDMR